MGDGFPGPASGRAARAASAVADKARSAAAALRTRLSKQPWVIVVAATAVAVVIASLVALPPLAVSIARSRAQAMGLTLHVDSASLGFGTVKLHGVSMDSVELPGVRASLDTIVARPAVTMSLGELEVHGGKIELEGELDDLAEHFREWRKRHSRGENTAELAGGGSAADIRADGISVKWRQTFGGDAFDAWGVSYSRTRGASEVIGVDFAQGSHGAANVEVANGHVELARDGGKRLLTHPTVSRLKLRYDMDARTTSAGTPRVTPANDDDSNRGARLRARIGSTAARLSEFLPAADRLEVGGIHFELRRNGQSLNVGPATVVVETAEKSLRVSLSSGSGLSPEAKDPITFQATVPRGPGQVDVQLTGGPVPLAALGVNEDDMGLRDVAGSELGATGSARLSPDGGALFVSGRASLSNLSILQPRLAHDAVHGLSVSLAGQLDMALDGSLTTLKGVELGVGRAKLLVTGTLTRADGHASGNFHVEAPLSACSDVLEATPAALVPLLNGVHLAGTFTFAGDVAFDTRRPADAKVDFTGANDCRITQVPPTLSLDRFKRPWQRVVKGEGGFPTTIESGPGTPGWVPYAAISPYMATAVVICEDARFFSHGGFDAKSIQSSIRDNLREGRFVRGASTVSMQLAKNLFLEREKTLSRKLQEAVLTLLLEQSLRKEEILELYLNVVEFGPGIYGIGPAAAHYFRSSAKDLSLGQALYLATLLPNPKIHHFGTDGLLRPAWADYLRKLMKIAHKIHKIDDRELEIGLEETVQFGVAATADAALRGVPPGVSGERDDVPELDAQ